MVVCNKQFYHSVSLLTASGTYTQNVVPSFWFSQVVNCLPRIHTLITFIPAYRVMFGSSILIILSW